MRSQASLLERAAVGEYLGHHEDFELAAMHAYIDAEATAGQAIDIALRSLLAQFRLPGEAQKIDRIMEKFAERYVKDNPSTFRTADAAYVLSFAIIMLNTDAHNPLAERRIGSSDFVSMNMSANEEGVYEPVMPVAELEAIYARIVVRRGTAAACCMQPSHLPAESRGHPSSLRAVRWAPCSQRS